MLSHIPRVARLAMTATLNAQSSTLTIYYHTCYTFSSTKLVLDAQSSKPPHFWGFFFCLWIN